MSDENEYLTESCCGDPEICVNAVCVPCPLCGQEETLRVSSSEFICPNCRQFFEFPREIKKKGSL